MSKNNIIIIIVLILGGIVGFGVIQKLSNNSLVESAPYNKTIATIYKSPTCGCCGVYASYMKKEEYDVKIKNVLDMEKIKEKLGVPLELESCHTTEVGGYVVEGHIPQEAIRKLLTEKPDIKGIGMPDMPSGSPGMPGPKTEDFIIYEITSDGNKGDVFMII